MHLLRLRQWRTSVPWLLLLAIAAASTMPQTVSARLNQHTCHPEDISSELTDSHMKLYLLSLPEHLADKVLALCGTWHRLHLDATRLSDINPFGQPVRSPRQACSFGQLFATPQFASSFVWRQQITASPLLVSSLEDADLVVVDLQDEFCFINERYENSDELKQVYQQILTFIGEHQNKTNKPHMTTLTRIEREYSDYMHADSLLRMPGPKQLTILNIESTKSYDTGYHVVAQPYPVTIHMDAHDPYFTMIARMNQHMGGPAPCFVTRKKLIAGSSYVTRFPLRERLKKECEQAGPERCKHIEAGQKGSLTPSIIVDMHGMYARSWFCLMPHGDTPTRRAFFDCLMQDAIPVMFHDPKKETFAFSTDMLPFADILDPKSYIVFLEPEWEGNIIDVLEKRFPLEQRVHMVTTIFRIKHLFQGMLRPIHELLRFDQLHDIHCLDDSFTAAFKAGVRRMCRQGLIPEARCNEAKRKPTHRLARGD